MAALVVVPKLFDHRIFAASEKEYLMLYTVERILLTYLRTLLTYRKLPFADKLWTLEKNKGHFIILELKSEIIMWPYFVDEVFSL